MSRVELPLADGNNMEPARPRTLLDELKLPALVAGASLAAYELLYDGSHLRRWLRDTRAGPWVEVGTVKQINVYPLKSGAANALEAAACTAYGVRGSGAAECDRCWAVADANRRHSFLTGRQNGRIMLIRAECLPQGVVRFTVADGVVEPIEVRLAGVERVNDQRQIRTFADPPPISGLDAGDDAALWLRRALRVSDCEPVSPRLLWHGAGLRNVRHLSAFAGEWPELAAFDDRPMLADLAPYLLTCTASLDDVWQRLPAELEPRMARFRPNIVIETNGDVAPWDEDHWDEVRICGGSGEVLFSCAKLCGRCVMTTIDPVSGERSADGEPLNTLLGFRPTEDGGRSPCFGVYACARRTGTVALGDKVHVRYKHLTPPTVVVTSAD